MYRHVWLMLNTQNVLLHSLFVSSDWSKLPDPPLLDNTDPWWSLSLRHTTGCTHTVCESKSTFWVIQTASWKQTREEEKRVIVVTLTQHFPLLVTPLPSSSSCCVGIWLQVAPLQFKSRGVTEGWTWCVQMLPVTSLIWALAHSFSFLLVTNEIKIISIYNIKHNYNLYSFKYHFYAAFFRFYMRAL